MEIRIQEKFPILPNRLIDKINAIYLQNLYVTWLLMWLERVIAIGVCGWLMMKYQEI